MQWKKRMENMTVECDHEWKKVRENYSMCKKCKHFRHDVDGEIFKAEPIRDLLTIINFFLPYIVILILGSYILSLVIQSLGL